MVRVSDPGERAQDRNGNRKGCEHAHNQHSGMVVAMINKDQGHSEY